MRTTVIELYGGPCSGKSTLAAGLYYELKKQGKSAEICREYVKDWAYENRKIGKHDQIYIMGKQIRKESMLYDKVDYIITDSPILLSAFYEEYYQNLDICKGACLKFLDSAEVERKSYFLERNKVYNTEGRYESEEESDKLSQALFSYILSLPVNFTLFPKTVDERLEFIINDLK